MTADKDALAKEVESLKEKLKEKERAEEERENKMAELQTRLISQEEVIRYMQQWAWPNS